MFRAQQNEFDNAVAKATDENLTSENWEFIMDVCDRANASDSGARDVVAALIKRLAHRNANVQLYTLELANAVSQNCGIKVHTELASRSFTEALLRLANDRNTHQQVKAKILERMHEWTQMFANDRNLGIMEQAYSRLKSQNPNLEPPSKPTKQQITDADRQKEEEELQIALELSVKDKGERQGQSSAQAGYTDTSGDSDYGQQQQQQQQQASQPVPSGTTAATVSRVRALFDFQPSEPGELEFKKGDIIAVLESVYKDWWKGSLRGHTGIFPLNYVEKLSDPTPEELQREAQMESEVFAEIKNVEKLLTLLGTSSSEMNVRDNEEITTLYHSTLAIRPKLIELIGKYSQRKDDFTQLNEKFIKARRDYESLLEASMSHPPASHVQQPGYSGRPGPGPGPAAYNYAGYPPQGPPQAQQQHDAGRYYTPNPQDQRPPNGPQPFYMAPAQAPLASHAPYPPSEPRTDSPLATMRPGGVPGSDAYVQQQQQHTQQAAYDQPPHELSAPSSYSSTLANQRQSSYPLAQGHPAPLSAQPYQEYSSPAGYGPEDPYGAQPATQQQPQGTTANPYPAPLSVKQPHAHPQQFQQYGQGAPPGSPPPGAGAVGPQAYQNIAGAAAAGAASQQGQAPSQQHAYQAYQPPR